MRGIVKIGRRKVGHHCPVFIVGEIGINHNGNLDIAKKLIDSAKDAGCDAVKFQKRTPEVCIPLEQQGIMRETPWGYMTYLEYKHKIEFGQQEYNEIDQHCKDKDIIWFASCWDSQSLDFIEHFNPPAYKIASACLTNSELLLSHKKTSRSLILSTGMSNMPQIQEAVNIIGKERLILTQSTSTYPCEPNEINLRVIQTLRDQFGCPIGYSGHETGLATTVAAVALDACYIERHITLDRSMWGTDQSASVEPNGLARLVRDIRTVEMALGDGSKKIWPSEIPIMNKLRQRK